MRVRWFAPLFVVGAVLAAGCGASDCEVDSSCTPDVIADTGVDIVEDSGTDTVVPRDVADDTSPDIQADTITPEDAATDATPDAVNDATAGECATDYDCEGCESCIDQDGVMTCVDMTIYAGVKQCYSDEDCDDGLVCHYYPVGRPECGGSCSAGASYALHEWGVNVVTIGGGATMSAGPRKYYGAVVAKPVIYIYSDDEFKLDVRVDYTSGVSYETWPVVPNDDTVVWEGVQVSVGECVPTPTPEPDMSGMAEVDSLEIYDLPDWVIPDANCLTFGETVSRLLFYTGPLVGYEPPVVAEMNVTADSATVNVTNNLGNAVGPVYFLYRSTDSNCLDPSYCPVHTARIAWKIVDSVPAGGPTAYDMEFMEVAAEVTEENPYPSVDLLLPGGWTDLPGLFKTTLIDKGLTEAEADVFMNAWTESMFGLLGQDADWYYPSYNNGGFMIYPWTEARATEMLPLTAVPAPETTARALIEYQQVPVVLPD